jgi:hypothetical protein
MKLFLKTFHERGKVLGLTPRHHIGFALTGGIAALAVCGGMLLGLFGVDSSSPWLPAGPEAVAQVAACRQQQPQRAAREVCVRQAAAEQRRPVAASTP